MNPITNMALLTAILIYQIRFKITDAQKNALIEQYIKKPLCE